MNSLLEELNPPQRTAVEQTEGPLLILAGAGSGKTRVITYRIAYLIETLGVSPGSILAVTFTNKAAAQMKERVAVLLTRYRDGDSSREEHPSSPAGDPDADYAPGGAVRAAPLSANDGSGATPAEASSAGDEPLLASDFLDAPPASLLQPAAQPPAPEARPPAADQSPRRQRAGRNAPYISTFHSFCVYALRRNIDRLGYNRDFSIYDDDDQIRLVKTCIKELGLVVQLPSPRGALAQLSYAKNHGLSPEELYQSARREETAKVALVYDLYERKLRQASALDFDDLLLKTVALFDQAADLRENYNRRFRYVMVDEYQDTNRIQYRLIRQLTLLNQNLCVVGDEDQSIYRWRGADIGTKVIRLEQNYRSTQVILNAAGAVVSHNVARKGKTLWTERGKGQHVGLYEARDADEEGWFVAGQVLAELRAAPQATVAVLYRTNAQSRILEEAMRRQQIEYRMVGGFSFYGRAEIKDVLAYARLAGNLHDSGAFTRVLNSPARGIGETTVGLIEDSARQNRLSLWEALEHELAEKRVPPRSLKALESFDRLIRQLAEDRTRERMSEFFNSILDRSGYLRALEAENTPDAQGRIENLRELVNAARAAEESGETLAEFLDRAALVSDIDTYDPNARVTLMTLHTAKGLEFSAVFMVGLEEGLFPHKFSTQDQDEIEEERRLCYVGMTRARNRLVLSWARERRSFAAESYGSQRPSRFLREIPEELIEHLNLTTFAGKPRLSWENAIKSPEEVNRFIQGRARNQHRPRPRSGLTFTPPPRASRRWKLGAQVRHPKYGLGTVVECDGDDENSKVTVRFANYGTKKLVERYATLEKA